MEHDAVGPDEWRELNRAPLPETAAKYPCAALKSETGDPCKNDAIAGTPFCRFHGGTTVAVQDQARRRIEAVKATLFDKLLRAANTAVDTYIEVCKSGEKDSDRLRAADRILELVGVREDIISVHVSGTTEHQVTDLDAALVTALRTVGEERFSRAIDTTAVDVDADD